MQTSALYNRLRREEKEEPKRTCISPLAFVQLLSHQFTTAVAVKLGEEMGIKERAVRHHLRTLCVKGYIERLRQGVYRKVTRRINGKKKSSVIAQDSVILSQDTPRDASLRSAWHQQSAV